MSVFDTREIAAKKSRTFFDVALRHSFLQAVISDGLADVHKEIEKRLPRLAKIACIVTRVVRSGKRKLAADFHCL